VSYTDDGEAMHEATLAVGGEGTVSKKTGIVCWPGQRVRWWTKTKHRRTSDFEGRGMETVHAVPARWSDRG
jgi:ATP-dependent DNA ligase